VLKTDNNAICSTSWQYNGDHDNIFVDIQPDAESGEEDIERLRRVLKDRDIAARMYL